MARKPHRMIFASLVANGGLTAFLFSISGHFGVGALTTIVPLVLFIPYLVSLIGVVVLVYGPLRTGARMYQIASAFFIPLGAIGMIGAAKMLDEAAERAFRDRLNAKKTNSVDAAGENGNDKTGETT